MVDLLRRHAAIVVALILAWLGWADMNPDVGKKKAEAKIERREIGESSLRVRGADELLASITDPYRLAQDAAREASIKAAKAASSASKSGGTGAKPAIEPGSTHATGGSPRPAAFDGPPGPSDPAEVAAAWLGALRLLGRDVTSFARSLVHGPAPAAPAGQAPPGAMAEPPPRPASFVLHLESTLCLPDGGQARICGQTVEVGASLEGLDPEKPPRLLSVRGTEAVVAHGDDLYVLDLVSRPVVTVGEPALAAAEAARARVGDAMEAAPPRAVAAQPAKPAAAPAAASSGGKVPHVRKFPQKKKP